MSEVTKTKKTPRKVTRKGVAHGKPSSLPVRDRHSEFLRQLPEYEYNVYQTAIAAGFSEKTANKQGKRILAAALNREAKITQSTPEKIREKVGLSREQVVEQYVKVVKQDRDLNSKLKAMKPLLAEEDIHLEPDNQVNVQIPTLNITMKD